VLVNAVYLRADWAVAFQTALTRTQLFHAPTGGVTVPFMHSTEARRYATGAGWQAVDLDYAGGQLAMTILVPDPGRYDTVVGHLSTTTLDALAAGGEAAVDLALPKFDIEQSLQLKQQLSELGMPTAFTDRADFSGMITQEQLQLKDVLHQANVTIDEKGTVATAATAAVAEATAAPSRSVTLVVDRPFVFLLRDRSTGAIIFAGQVTNPATK
jgi:serpin B